MDLRIKTMKKTKNYVGEIPFNIFGDQLHYPESYSGEYTTDCSKIENGKLFVKNYYDTDFRSAFFDAKTLNLQIFNPPQKHQHYNYCILAKTDNIIWIDNYTFSDVLIFDGYARGRSAAYFYLKSQTDNRRYTCFLTDFESIIFDMQNGIISGDFTFCKRGQNYGIVKV